MWVIGFLRHLKQAYDPTRNSDFIYLGLDVIAYLSHQARIFGKNEIGSRSYMKILDNKRLAQEFLNSNRCLILIDHEALPCKPFSRGDMIPEEKTLEDLHSISSDTRNIVCIMSN